MRLERFNKVLRAEKYTEWKELPQGILDLSEKDFAYFLVAITDEVVDIVVNNKKTVIGICGIDGEMGIGVYSLERYLAEYGDTYIKEKL